MDTKDFVIWEMTSRDSIDFKKIYVDVSGDLIAGLLLSQIVYWHLPSKETGKTKLRVKKDGFYWIAKERGDWWDEIRITPKQFDRAVKILEKKNLVILEKFKFDGLPLVHTRLDWDNFLNALDAQMNENLKEIDPEPYSPLGIPQRSIPESTKREFPNPPKVNSRIDQRGIPLTKNTDIDYNKDYDKDYQSIAPQVIQIAIKVLGPQKDEVRPERLNDIINTYYYFYNQLTLMDLMRILFQIKIADDKKRIDNFQAYLWSAFTHAVRQTESTQIQPKQPIHKEQLPEWFEDEHEPNTGVKKDTELSDEEKAKEIKEILSEFKNKD